MLSKFVVKFCDHTTFSIGECVVCTWNWIQFLNQTQNSWIWKLKLKLKDLEIETIVLKLSPKELANKFYNVKTKKLDVLFKNKMEQH